MGKATGSVITVTFFCALGWACIGPAIGADEDAQAPYEEGAAAPVPSSSPAGGGSSDASDPAGAQGEGSTGEAQAQPASDRRGVNVGRYDTVSLNVQETSLTQVLQLLSTQGRRNIIPSPKVSGTVTANLYDVTFHEALDAILQQNGAGYIEKGNFIYVYTQEELQQIRQEQRTVQHRVFELDYITANDASTFVTPLLSQAGSIAVSGEVGGGFEPDSSDGGANSYANAETMVVRDYPENLEEIATVLEKLDTRPQQVLVEATILQADLTEDLAFGVDVSVLGDIGLDDVASGGQSSLFDAVGDMISGDIREPGATAGQTTVGNVGSGRGGVKVGVLSDNVQVFFRALDEITDTTVLAHPKILALNRQRAEVHVGERVAYLSTTATSTATTQTVDFLETGTNLALRPFVSSDGMIRLELKPSISSADARDITAGNTVVTLPDETSQELTTNVMVRDGQTVVLGGLFKEDTTVSRRQVPGLGDIPIVGNAFRGQDDTVRRSEVIFLITPHIVKDRALARAGAGAKDEIERIREGSREALLPWSNTKLASSYLRDALRQLKAGNREKALWEVDMALDLHPRMNEALRLKERLMGYQVYEPGGSLLDETVDAMIQDQTGRRPRPRRPVDPDPEPVRMRPAPLQPSDHLPSDENEADNSADGDETDGAEEAEGSASAEQSGSADAAATEDEPQAEGEPAEEQADPQPEQQRAEARSSARSGSASPQRDDSREAGASDAAVEKSSYSRQQELREKENGLAPESRRSINSAIDRYFGNVEPTAGTGRPSSSRSETADSADESPSSEEESAETDAEAESSEDAAEAEEDSEPEGNSESDERESEEGSTEEGSAEDTDSEDTDSEDAESEDAESEEAESDPLLEEFGGGK